jgi:hypothetical protein
LFGNSRDNEGRSVPEKLARQRAINFIEKNWGKLGDLPKPVIAAVWVTVYRTLETASKVEAEGGSKGLLKNTLIGDRRLLPELKEATARIEFLQKMIPAIRSNPSNMEKLADGQLLVDILKWNILDAADMSVLKRAVLRRFAKVDPEYKRPIPPEIT